MVKILFKVAAIFFDDLALTLDFSANLFHLDTAAFTSSIIVRAVFGLIVITGSGLLCKVLGR